MNRLQPFGTNERERLIGMGRQNDMNGLFEVLFEFNQIKCNLRE